MVETPAQAARRRRSARLFNITQEEYETILHAQGGVCYVCKRPPTSFKQSLSVDHDHKTGQVRGILCWMCNRAIGALRDNAEMAKNIHDYLVAPPAVLALGEMRFGLKGRVTKKRRKSRKRTVKK